MLVNNADLTERQFELLSDAWQNFKKSNNHRLQCAFALWALKKDLDADDLGGSGTGDSSKFWKLFEQGALPFSGDGGRRSVFTALEAAEWVAEQKCKGLHFSIERLAPATIVEIKALDDRARKVVYDNLATSEFIGVAAVRLLKSINDSSAFKKLETWVAEHKGKALTPASIRPIADEVEARRAKRERAARIAADQERIAASAPAGAQTIDVSSIGRTPEELERKRKADEVQAVWDEKDAETAAKIKGDYQALAEAFTKADAALKTYRSTLKNLITLNGSAYINQLRQYQSPISGFNAIENDIEIISTQWRGHLVVIAEQLTTEQGPSTINFDDPNLVEVEVNQ